MKVKVESAVDARRAGEYNATYVRRASIMQMVKIQIPDSDECAKAFSALIRRGRVDCYRDNVFIIPEPGLQLLHDMSISYVELRRGELMV
jgi:hypothetical protein